MGIYINRTSTGEGLPAIGKVDALIADGAKRTLKAEFQPNLICVVENPAFDAAMYCETEADFKRTQYKEDTRKKTYLVHEMAMLIADL